MKVVAPTDPFHPDIVDVDEKPWMLAELSLVKMKKKKKTKVRIFGILYRTDYCEQEPQVSIRLQKFGILSSDCRFRHSTV